ncbi:Leucine-rich repeat-containing protein [Artemisia annua]|uniref:Leucine-rich repeat-containing protein n=1 Tax=Artemisia annua TaxID=35608 RepID=A0A2U1L0L5_ARTAN|nr:Leucine-rich repeat-containing protein [Artemisia annua]
MECNRDEANRAKEIAERKFNAKDIRGAKKIALKAQALCRITIISHFFVGKCIFIQEIFTVPDNLRGLRLSSIDHSINRLSGSVPSDVLNMGGYDAFAWNKGLCESNCFACTHGYIQPGVDDRFGLYYKALKSKAEHERGRKDAE